MDILPSACTLGNQVPEISLLTSLTLESWMTENTPRSAVIATTESTVNINFIPIFRFLKNSIVPILPVSVLCWSRLPAAGDDRWTMHKL